MKTFLEMSLKERRLTCTQVEDRLGLQAASVEKDFWVCWTLRLLGRLENIGTHLTFKGGTSLSKGWRQIKRFSEDIDLVIDRAALGQEEGSSPENAPSRSQRKKRVEAMVAASVGWVQGPLQSALRRRVLEELGGDGWVLEVDPDVDDGQCLLFTYPAAFRDKAGYVRPVVKLELGARGAIEPTADCELVPYVAETFPELFTDARFSFRTLSAERTFWEKAMLLHELGVKSEKAPGRMARHYYDIWCLIRGGVGGRAASDDALFTRVRDHRAIFFPVTNVDYGALQRGKLRMLPPPEKVDVWRRDYEAMRGGMFFEDPPDFEEVLEVVGTFERDFNRSG